MHVYAQEYELKSLLSFFPWFAKWQNRDGELAQLARASALQAEGQGFEPPILQEKIFET